MNTAPGLPQLTTAVAALHPVADLTRGREETHVAAKSPVFTGFGAPRSLQVALAAAPQDCFELQAAWQQLLARCDTADLFMTPTWHQAWWRAFGAGCTPAWLQIRDGVRLVGLLPLCSYIDRWRGLPVRVLGSYNNAHASRTGFLLEPGFEVSAADALARYLQQTTLPWDVLLLQQIAADAPWLQAFLPAATGQGLRVFGPTGAQERCVLPLKGGWDHYVQQRGRHFRTRMRENERRVARAGAVTFVNDNSAQSFEQLLALEQHSWKGQDGAAALGAAGWDFQREVALAPSSDIECHNVFMHLNQQPIGAVHAVAFRGRAYSMQTLFAQEHSALYPGRVQFAAHVHQMFEQPGLDRLDLNGDSPFCRSWTEASEPYVNVQVFGRQWYSRTLGWIKQGWGRT